MLLLPHSNTLLSLALDLNDLVTKGLSEAQQGAVRTKLAESLGPKYREVILKERAGWSTSRRGLTFSQCAHLLSVLYLACAVTVYFAA